MEVQIVETFFLFSDNEHCELKIEHKKGKQKLKFTQHCYALINST